MVGAHRSFVLCIPVSEVVMDGDRRGAARGAPGMAKDLLRAGAWIVVEGTASHIKRNHPDGAARGGRVPPAVWGAVAFGMQIAVGGAVPLTRLRALAASAAAGASGWLMFGSVLRFYRQSTTIDPLTLRPESLVDSGPNRLTRNPMYLGIAGTLLAHAIARGSVRALVPVALFVVVIDRLQIAPEESAMRERFGAEYDRYVERTPRWLGLRSLRARL